MKRSLLRAAGAAAPGLISALPASAEAGAGAAVTEPAAAAPRWLKGNLHTHSRWSDGDDYPEMITDWYKREGYHFLAMSDHNVMAEGQWWFALKPPTVVAGQVVQHGGGAVLEKYVARFGAEWVEQREVAGARAVRL
ncbi:MAG: hypothetical protein H7343_05410 [Undibacterium sp.]|nr:hypothetical protein [Opitutaceae bacterium]